MTFDGITTPWRLRAAALILGAFVVGPPAVAEEGTFPPPGWSAPAVRIEGRGHTTTRHSGRAGHVRRDTVAAASGSTTYRGLTINRRFDTDSDPDDDDVLFDGETHYGNIRRFNPAPFPTSGTQFPFGLDGIGGYGSDIGILAGEDSDVYQRQP